MNGIVTGKQEKQAGSLVWKTALSWAPTSLNQDTFDVPNSTYLYSPYFLKLTITDRGVSYIPIDLLGKNYPYTCLFVHTGYNYYLQMENNFSSYIVFEIVGAASSLELKDWMTLAEIGTFE